MRLLTAIALTVGFLTAPAVVAAQDGGGSQYKETTTYDFSGDDVSGNLVKPSGSGIQGEQHGKTSNLIDIRSDFIPEMLKTVEDL